jgi:segregation and condensation protein B
MTPEALRNVLEAAMLAAGRALSLDDFLALFEGSPEAPDRESLRAALDALGASLAERPLELVQVASGYRLQVCREYSLWLGGLFSERPPRYSRALLETLALIAYRQPVTRGEIEEVRGVAVSSNIIKTLMEREWIRVLGHREVPGRPALYGTTREFLDHFGLRGLDGLPGLAEIRDLDRLEPDLFSALAHAAQEAPGQDGEVFAAHTQAMPAAPDEAGNDEGTGDGADDALELGADPVMATGVPAADEGGGERDDVLASAARGSGADAAPAPEHADAPIAVTAADALDEAADDSADDAVAGDDAGGAGRAAPRAAEHDAADARPAADDDGAARGA